MGEQVRPEQNQVGVLCALADDVVHPALFLVDRGDVGRNILLGELFPELGCELLQIGDLGSALFMPGVRNLCCISADGRRRGNCSGKDGQVRFRVLTQRNSQIQPGIGNIRARDGENDFERHGSTSLQLACLQS